MVNDPLLQRLRNETRNQHAQLEEQLQLMRPEMRLEDYRSLLECFWGFYAPWEGRAASTIVQILPDFLEQRSKTALLLRDLDVLGSDLNSIPLVRDLPPTDSLAAVLGSLYVVEGATLGGQLLARHFHEKFALTRDRGCAFFSSYGPEVGQRWRGFCEALVAHSSPATEGLTVQSAIQTFSCLGSWLLQRGSAAVC